MAKHEGPRSGTGDCRAACLGKVCFVAASFIAVMLVSCAPRPSARAFVSDDYATWGRTTELRLDYPIPGHEDNYRIIYMNDTGFRFSRTGAGRNERVEFPEGTVIAKEVYAGSSPEPGARPTMITAMIKDADNPDARGGWVWVAKNLSMGKENIITGDFCFTCHANANEAHPYGDKNPDEGFRDFVFFIPDIP